MLSHASISLRCSCKAEVRFPLQSQFLLRKCANPSIDEHSQENFHFTFFFWLLNCFVRWLARWGGKYLKFHSGKPNREDKEETWNKSHIWRLSVRDIADRLSLVHWHRSSSFIIHCRVSFFRFVFKTFWSALSWHCCFIINSLVQKLSAEMKLRQNLIQRILRVSRRLESKRCCVTFNPSFAA